MHISSRTPEGLPNQCPICGSEVCIEPSTPPGDAPCPKCGCLLWFTPAVQPRIEILLVAGDEPAPESSRYQLGAAALLAISGILLMSAALTGSISQAEPTDDILGVAGMSLFVPALFACIHSGAIRE